VAVQLAASQEGVSSMIMMMMMMMMMMRAAQFDETVGSLQSKGSLFLINLKGEGCMRSTQ
jgi:hypothetical protein